MNLEPGNVYDGTVVAAWLETDYNDKDVLVVCFDIDTDSGAIRAKHKCSGDHAERTQKVVESFGVSWPNVDTIEQKAKGASCQVWIGEFDGKKYGRINVGGRGASDPEDVNRALRKLKGQDDEIPF